MSVFHNNVIAGAAGQGGAAADAGPAKSVRFNPGDSAYLNKTFSSGNRRTFTYSYWIKECGKGTSPSNNPHVLWSGTGSETRGGLVHRGTGSDANKLYIFNQESNTTNCQVWTNSLHRDFSAWKHIVWSIDTTQATSTNRVKLYINGVQETLNFATTPAQNLQLQINVNQEHRIGRGTPDDYGNFYLTDIHFIDGSQLDATSFGAFDSNGVWQAAEFSGTYGSNGFHLNFADGSDVGADVSGNNNDFTAFNISNVTGTGHWSTQLTSSSSFAGGYPPLSGFDGNTSSYVQASANGATLTFSPSPGIAYTSSIKILMPASGATASVNGGSAVSVSNSSETTIATGSGTLTSLVLTATNKPGFTYIKIDDSYLIDVRAEKDKDVLFDVPTNGDQTDTGAGGEVTGNYATMNPVVKFTSDNVPTFTNGNLKVTGSSGTSNTVSTIGTTSGKFYFEVTLDAAHDTNSCTIGLGQSSVNYSNNKGLKPSGSYNGTITSGSAFSYWHGDTVGIAFEPGVSASFFKNNNEANFAATCLSGQQFAWMQLGGTTVSATFNFGQRPFVHSLVQSSLVSGPIAGSPNDATKMFDGSTSTFTDHSSTNSTIKYSNTLTGVTSLRVYIHQGNSTGTVTTVGANGTQTDTISADFGPGWHTISLSNTGSTINSIAFTRGGSGNFLSIYAIEVNGVVLTDSTATGFKTLNTASLPTTTIADGRDYFDAKLWTGNSTDQRAITGYQFSPDLVYIKRRNATYGGIVMDTVRGLNSGHAGVLYTNATNAEDTGPTSSIRSFNSDGFNLGTDGGINYSGSTYVGWAWDAGSSNTSISAGGLNSSLYDSRTLWRDDLTGSIYSGQSAATLFNNSAQGIHAASGSSITFTTPSGYALSGTLEVHMARGTGASAAYGTYDVKVNGTSVFDHSKFPYNTNAIVNLGTFTSITSIEWGYGGNNANDWIQLNDIRVNGKELVDSDVTPVNIPTIASTVRANPTVGFSIVEWTGNGSAGATVSHGLNAAPEFIIFKRTSATENWNSYHASLGASQLIALNSSNAASSTNDFNNTAPTSSVFSLGSGTGNNANGSTYIGYCFSSVLGYSLVSSYTGNGSSDGVFVQCGFRPAFLLVKRTNGTAFWCIVDSIRDPDNVMSKQLYPNVTNAESSSDVVDFLSNGFKIRSTSNEFNTSSAPYIFYAVAENPFQANGGLAR